MASYLLRNSPVPTSEKKFTFSTWLKLSSVSTAADNGIVEWYKSSSERHQILIDSATRQLRCYSVEGGVVKINIYSDIALRDCHGWYHIVIQSDNTLASSSDRFKLWVNGVAQTFASYSWTFAQNVNINVFDGSGTRLNLGTRGEAYATWLNGYLADTYYIDGSIIAHTEFGETDATTGIWKPKTEPTIASFGNAGVHLKYENSGNIGLDSSGNGNNFSTSGTITQTVDTPSNVFATLNGINTSTSVTLANGNTKGSTTSSGWVGSASSLGFQKGFSAYWEAKCLSSTRLYFGLSRLEDYDIITGTTTEGQSNLDYMWRLTTANSIYYRGSNVGATYSVVSTGDIISCKVDADGTVKFYKNDSLVHTFSTPLVDGYYYFPIIGLNAIGGGTESLACNFGNGYFETTAVSSANSDAAGQGIFEYDTKSGYAICTKNINTQEYA